MAIELLSTTSLVETPIIIVNIGGITLGMYSKEVKNVIQGNAVYRSIITQYPNFMESLNVTKINGALNTYTLVMRYAITQFDDPNLLEKVFSKAKQTRAITLSYGDLSLPSYIYKEEEAIISDIKSQVDISSSTITYTLQCVSKALSLNAGVFTFPKKRAKPSDEIKKILYNNNYRLLEIFPGMWDKEQVLQQGLIAGDDIPVTIEAKQATTILDYLKYLVTCMTDGSSNGILRNNKYVLTIYDDINTEWGGTYFRVQRVDSSIAANSIDIYEINIGYPDNNMVVNFTVNTDQTYSILYDYAGDINQSNYVQRIDNNGNIISEFSPKLALNRDKLLMTESERAWWTEVTKFPINATLTIKGLLRPAILMSYVKLNVLFYGQAHISSGYYIITKQVDSINAGGYRTTLSLTRIGGADDY